MRPLKELRQPFADFWSFVIVTGRKQSMEWTGSIRWIHNPVQFMRIWIGLDQKFTNSTDSGMDWIQKCTMFITYLETFKSQEPQLPQEAVSAYGVTLTPEVLLSNLQL